MPELSQLVSEDSRQPIERMGRKALENIAIRAGLPNAAGMPKNIWTNGKITGGLLMLIQASGIDVTRADSGVGWHQVRQEDEKGGSHIETYPDVPAHQTARNGTNSSVELGRRLDAMAEKDDEIAELKAENDRLKDEMEERLAKLEAGSQIAQAIPLEQYLPWQIRKLAKARGMETKGKSDDEVRKELIDGENAARRNQ